MYLTPFFAMNVKPDEKPDGAPEWMVSYADMITIMMAFFVLMFAIASGEAAKGKNGQRQEAALASLQYRFGPHWQPLAGWGLAPGNSPARGTALAGRGPGTPPNGDEDGNVKVLKNERARIRVPGRGEHVVIGGVVYFNETSAQLADQQKAWLRTIADEMAGKPQQVEIVGHTSARPLPPGSPYHDRCDLAYARCRQAAGLLATLKIEPERLRITVLPASQPPPADEPATTPAEDARIDIYLTDTLSGSGP
ncbi:MAG: flagellar motor protein MotB [Thermoguttaceae bacterium]|jgi:chemotaxis protein MotB